MSPFLTSCDSCTISFTKRPPTFSKAILTCSAVKIPSFFSIAIVTASFPLNTNTIPATKSNPKNTIPIRNDFSFKFMVYPSLFDILKSVFPYSNIIYVS